MNVSKGQRTTYGVDISDSLSSVLPDKNDYIEVTEWTNCDGYHIEVFRHEKHRDNVIFDINWKETRALFEVLKTIINNED